MKKYKVVITDDAKAQLRHHLSYISNFLHNKTAAKAVRDDARETSKEISNVAESLNYCNNPKLAKLGYRKMNFRKHDYVMLYRIEGDTAFVEWIFHQLQDYENKFN